MKIRSLFALAATILGSTAVTLAQAAAPPAAAGFRGEFLNEVAFVGKRLTDLANAMPADKYAWRPASGVRSVGEVYVHVALGNVFLPSFTGAKIPEGYSRDMEKTLTDKAKVVDAMKNSFDHLKSFATSMSDADLEKKVKIFGGLEVTQRELMVIILNHMHEHLGQSIAYARMNSITPPWSETSDSPKPAKS
ncbi:MAG TPA: DinB family protein [Thermoanaerobaculia bacterium]